MYGGFTIFSLYVICIGTVLELLFKKIEVFLFNFLLLILWYEIASSFTNF